MVRIDMAGERRLFGYQEITFEEAVERLSLIKGFKSASRDAGFQANNLQYEISHTINSYRSGMLLPVGRRISQYHHDTVKEIELVSFVSQQGVGRIGVPNIPSDNPLRYALGPFKEEYEFWRFSQMIPTPDDSLVLACIERRKRPSHKISAQFNIGILTQEEYTELIRSI